MGTCLLILALAAGCPQPQEPDPGPPPIEDRWIAEDKLQHFALSFAATQMSYGGMRVAVPHDQAVTAASITALALGVAKEVHDVRIGRPFSLKDLAWDTAGVALATLLIRQIR